MFLQVCDCRMLARQAAGTPALLFNSQKFTVAGVDRHSQLGIFRAGAVHDVPDEFIGDTAPTEHVEDRSVWSLLQNLISSMFLRCLQCFVGIDFEKSVIEHMGGGIGGAICILVAGCNSG